MSLHQSKPHERPSRSHTASRNLEQDLREEMAFTDIALDSIVDLFYVLDLEGRPIRWNRRLAEVTGYSNRELRLMAVRDLHLPEELQRRADAIERVKRDGSAHEEMSLVTKDGRVIPHEFNASLLKDASGRPVALCGTARDITQRKQAEIRLRQSQEEFATLFHASPVALSLVELPENEAVGRFVEVNPAFEAMTGYGRDEIIGRTSFELGLWADPAERARLVGQLKANGTLRDIEVSYGTKSGDYRQCRGSADIVQVAGKPCVLTALVDITEHERNKSSLQETATRYKQLFERNLAGVFRSTTAGRILDCNDAFARILGADSATKLLSRRAQDFYASATDRELFLSALEKSGELHNFETELRRIDGTPVHVLENVALLTNGDGESYIEGTLIDVTEKRELEMQLFHSQKMEAIGRLAGGVAHDFNNLLTAICGYAELGAASPEVDDDLRGYFLEIQKAGERATELTRQLVAFSRQQECQPKVLDLNRVIIEFTSLLRRTLGEDIQFVTALERRLGQVKADSVQIEQVLMNLAVNGRDAMPQGGRLTIETRNVELDGEYVSRRKALGCGRYVMLAVSDDGHGMDAETCSRIFEPFYTTKEPEKGTGLGLATVYGIVKQSGGFIRVYSEPGEGTTFEVYLPRLDVALARASPAEAGTPAWRGTETILLVEDDKQILHLAETGLKRKGYTVLTAGDPAEAMELVHRHGSDIDLLLTDLLLPRGCGRELAERVIEALPSIRVLLMSGHGEPARFHQSTARKFSLLGKPFSLEELARSVRETMDPTAEGAGDRTEPE